MYPKIHDSRAREGRVKYGVKLLEPNHSLMYYVLRN